MSVTRHQENFNSVVEWTDAINEVENQYGLLNSEGIFETRSTSQTAIIFDKFTHEITLLPDADRKSRNGSYGKDRKVETFSLPLAFFDHKENITPDDIQGWRRPGSPDEAEALDRVRVEKLTDCRLAVDQTIEYMKIQAIKGVTTTPSGTVLADMFTEFNITLKEIDFDLGDSNTDVNAKIAELKRHIGANLKGAGPLRGIDVLVSNSFFDALVNHTQVRSAFLNYASNVRYQESLSRFQPWGVMDVFEYQGVRFMTYAATFNMPDGTTEDAFDDSDGGEGYAVPRAKGLFRGFYGPSNKLSGANQPGREMFAWEYRDPRDEFHEIQVQTAPLFFVTKPACIVRVHSSS